MLIGLSSCRHWEEPEHKHCTFVAFRVETTRSRAGRLLLFRRSARTARGGTLQRCRALLPPLPGRLGRPPVLRPLRSPFCQNMRVLAAIEHHRTLLIETLPSLRAHQLDLDSHVDETEHADETPAERLG